MTSVKCAVRLTLVTAAAVCTLAASPSVSLGQSLEKHVPQSVISDWTHRHVVYPYSNDVSVLARVQKDRRWVNEWYMRHPEAWWPESKREERKLAKGDHRDWSYPTGSANFGPLFDFTFSIGTQTGFGSLNATDQGNGEYLAYAGGLTVTGMYDAGSYSLYPGGPAITTSPSGQFIYDNTIYPFYPTTNPIIDVDGLLFRNSTTGFEVNIWGNAASSYEYDDTGYIHDNTGNPFSLVTSPGGGQTYPAKYVFDVTAAPSCTNDYVAIGLQATPASGGQANIIGLNNLYTGTAPAGICSGSGPTVKFAYASGSGQIPSDIALSQDGKRIAYVENSQTGSSYFHVLTIGTTGANGTSATAAVVPGVGNNATDNRVLLSPDGGVTSQNSTSSVFVSYYNDYAYVTTYSETTGTGYLYKIGDVMAGNGIPAIVWQVAITAIPSSPVYDSVSNKIFFTDNQGRLDYVTDNGSSPSAVQYSALGSTGTTSTNPVVIDSVHQYVYASFNSDGTNAIVVQVPTNISSFSYVTVGSANTTYTGPYAPDFNNAFYTGTGTPLMYVVGTGSGTTPTLYSVGFNGSGVLNGTATASTALTSGVADASPVTEFYNAATLTDYLFVGVTNHCVATIFGGSAGCIMSLNISAGFPLVTALTPALAAAGGTTGIIVDNDSTSRQASSVYYGTKSGSTLVKATQSGLN